MTHHATLTEWTTALRSGTWPQTMSTMGALSRKYDGTCEGGLCCLGVLAVIEDRLWFAQETTRVGNEVTLLFVGSDGALFKDGMFGNENVQTIFSQANDNGATFAQIADLAELVLTEDLRLKPGLDATYLHPNTTEPWPDEFARLCGYVDRHAT